MTDYGRVVGVSAPRWLDDIDVGSPQTPPQPAPVRSDVTRSRSLRHHHTVNFRENLRMAQDGILITLAAKLALDNMLDVLSQMRTLAIHATSGYLDTIERDYAGIAFASARHQLNVFAETSEHQGVPLFTGAFTHHVVISRTVGPDETIEIDFSPVTTATLFLDRLTIEDIDQATKAVPVVDDAIARIQDLRDETTSIQQRLEHLLSRLDDLLNLPRPRLANAATPLDLLRIMTVQILRCPDQAFDGQTNLLRLDSSSLVRSGL